MLGRVLGAKDIDKTFLYPQGSFCLLETSVELQVYDLVEFLL